MSTALPTPSVFWNDIFPAQTPVVWRGGAADFELVRLASRGEAELVEVLKQRSGHRPVVVTGAPPSAGGRLGFTAKEWVDWSRRTTTLSGALDDILEEARRPTGHCLYMQSANTRTALPELAEPTAAWHHDASRMFGDTSELWIGSGGQRVAIHEDSSHGMVVMVAGSKEFVLFPPDQEANLYTAPQKLDSPWRSAVDPRAPDLARWPRFERAMATAQTIRIEAGDVLFVPAGWWHCVDSHGFNVMYNARWHDVDAATFAASGASFVHAVLAARRLAPDAAAAFRSALEDHAFSRAPGELDAGTRDRWLSQLRASASSTAATDTRPPAADDSLVVAADVRATFGDEGVVLADATGTRGHVLAWDLVPILQRFTSPMSSHDALADLRREFDVDADTLFACVRDLVAHGVLVRPDVDVDAAADARRCADAALAHVVLATAALPLHHRAAIQRRIDIHGFGVHGDPYPGVAPDDQGIFGAPMDAPRARVLEEVVRRSVHEHFGLALVADDLWSTPYVLHQRRSCAIGPQGLGFADPVSHAERRLRWEHLEVLAHFRRPTSPAEVFEEIRDTWTTTPEDFRALAASWIVSGALVQARHETMSLV